MGRSSNTQCPVSFNTTTVTSEATNFICCASASPNDFSPPMDSTGIVSFVCANSAKSFAACGNDPKYAQAALNGAKSLSAILPNAQYRSLEGRSHSAVLMAPQSIAAAVEQFFLNAK